MTTIQVAAAQISPQITAVAENRDKIEDALRRAVTKGARLLVCPECALTGYAYDSRVEASPHAETMPGPASDYLGRITRELDAYLIFGLLEKDGTRLYNSAALLGPEGLLAVYRKTHLPVLGVDRFADAGNGPLQVIQTPIGGIGMMICYDAVFPECARELGLGGADILALPTNYPVGKANRIIEHVLPARTIENRVFLVAANRVGLERGTTFAGRSCIIDVSGELLAAAGADREEIIMAQIDPALARQKRIVVRPGEYETDCDAHRRPDLYHRLTES